MKYSIKTFFYFLTSIGLLTVGILFYSKVFFSENIKIGDQISGKPTSGTDDKMQEVNKLSIPIRSDSVSYKDIVSIVENSKVDVTPPSWLQATGNIDPQFWIQKVLPFTGERNYDNYIIIPQLGIIVPLLSIDPTSSTYKQVLAGGELHWTHFTSGAILYPGTPELGQTGNALIGAHSNYYYSDPSYYRTIFTTLPELIKDDVVIGLSKTSTGRLVYQYRVFDSYQTAGLPDQVIAQPIYKQRITLYTCVPIGTSNERWIVQAELSGSIFVPFE